MKRRLEGVMSDAARSEGGSLTGKATPFGYMFSVRDSASGGVKMAAQAICRRNGSCSVVLRIARAACASEAARKYHARVMIRVNMWFDDPRALFGAAADLKQYAACAVKDALAALKAPPVERRRVVAKRKLAPQAAGAAAPASASKGKGKKAAKPKAKAKPRTAKKARTGA